MSALTANPFGDAVPATTTGEAQLAKREEAETMARVAMAKRFPRDRRAASGLILNEFTRVTLCEVAQYQYSKGGTDVSGPSIRAAEAMAQCWGNLDRGWREVERGIGPDGVGFSRVEAYCWDLESTNREAIVFFVRHWRDTKRGGYPIKDERDIYELCANQAQRRKRACILAILPGDVVEAAMQQVNATMNAKADTSPEGLQKMLSAFEEYGVDKEMIEKRIQRKLEAIRPAQVVQLKRIYASLRDGMSEASEWFEVPLPPEAKPEGATTLADIKAKANPPAATPAASPAPDVASTPAPPPAEGEAPQGDLLGGGQAAQLPITFEELKSKLQKARTMESLDTHADWIRHFTDPAQKLQLDEVYNARRAALEGKA